MNAIQTLRLVGEEYHAQLEAINEMTLTDWVALARKLEVETNNREHAAKKMALRKLRTEGKIS